MGRLRDIIRQLISEEAVWNYWSRRPRNSAIRDVSGEIEADREMMYSPVADSFDMGVSRLIHAIEAADSIEALEDVMEQFGVDAYEVVVDPTRFDQVIGQGDVSLAKMQLVAGIQTWSREKLEKTQDDYDSFELARSLDV